MRGYGSRVRKAGAGAALIAAAFAGFALRAEEAPIPPAVPQAAEESVTFCYRAKVIDEDEAKSAVGNYCRDQGRVAHFVEPQECDLQPAEGDREWAIKRCMGERLREPRFTALTHVQPLPYRFLTVVCRLPGAPETGTPLAPVETQPLDRAP